MVALGRALMARPKLLLLDEPSLGIAPILVQQIFASLAELKQAGVTMLLVEQNMSAGARPGRPRLCAAHGRGEPSKAMRTN